MRAEEVISTQGPPRVVLVGGTMASTTQALATDMRRESLTVDVATADLDRNEGILATAMHCVNAIPYVVDAAPGIRTYLDLPLMPARTRAR